MSDIQICQYCNNCKEVGAYSYNCIYFQAEGKDFNKEVKKNEPCPFGNFNPDPYRTIELSPTKKHNLKLLAELSKRNKANIYKEIYRAFEKLGADSVLLSIIGSFGDTLSTDEVAEMLREYNGR